MGGASTASALQLPAAMASSSAAKNDSPGKGPSARRPSPSAYFKKTQKTQSITKQTKMVGRSSEDPQGRTQSSLQTTDIPLWRQRWTMRFQILTTKILFNFFMPMILQWNICGLQANREELDLLFSNLDSTVICIALKLIFEER